eukprot:TRINITY_DN67067_c4_g8_i1.p1 TRINITY_DN67067_c4_g8~~TRINITY_DN67067_c4_g8_i1.p1  ORF type:complete len:400 (-),score=23.90 TRINITY_DN67067_c4_g8_i1:806-2005(-)
MGDFPQFLELPEEFKNPLHIACKQGSFPAVQSLIDSAKQQDAPLSEFINAEESTITPLWVAASCGHHECAELLISSGAEYNKRSTPQQAAPLYVAAQNGHLEVVKVLVACDAIEIDCRTRINATPLFIATQHGHLDVLKVLCEANCDINAPLLNGMTPYIASCLKDQSQVAQYLIRQGVNIDSQASEMDGLQWAKSRSNWDCILAVFQQTADIGILRKYYNILKGRAERRLALRYGSAPWLFSTDKKSVYKIVATTIISNATPDYEPVFGNTPFSAGKHSCQVRTATPSFAVGVCTAAFNPNTMSFINSPESYVFMVGCQQKVHNGTYTPYGKGCHCNDVVEMTLDLDTADGVLSFKVDGEDQGVAFTGLSAQKPITPTLALYWPHETLTVLKSSSVYS